MNSSPPSDAITLPGFEDAEAAARRLAGKAVRTPLLESPLLNDQLGCRLLIKAEPLQRTGSFKFRGAYNAVSQLDDEARRRGVVAYSSGNHAQGVAAASAMLDVPAVIVMPSDAPAIKLANTRAWGAEVVTYDRTGEDRQAICEALARERGAAIIRPYDDRHVIAGQATVGLEIAAQCEDLGIEPDSVVVPCGGGGLSSGIAIALRRLAPKAKIWTAEPEGYDDTARSLAAGRRIGIDATPPSIVDALLAPMPGEMTFEILRDTVAGGLAVDESAVERAMAAAFAHFKLVVEPGGAVAVASVLERKLDYRPGATIVCVCSGGNVDPALFADILRRNPA